jgi:peptidyl-tRNA hydrolase
MVEYSSAAIYIDSQQSLVDKITAIDAVIDALMSTGLKAAETGDLSEYYLDSGQTKITAKYRNPNEILTAIKMYEGLKSLYVNRLNGRQVRQIPEQNFRFPNRCR